MQLHLTTCICIDPVDKPGFSVDYGIYFVDNLGANVETLAYFVENSFNSVYKYLFFCGKVRFFQNVDRLHVQDREGRGSGRRA